MEDEVSEELDPTVIAKVSKEELDPTVIAKASKEELDPTVIAKVSKEQEVVILDWSVDDSIQSSVSPYLWLMYIKNHVHSR